MTLYARSDVASVHVPVESGGCGTDGGHSRPVINGAPQHPWPLTCLECEDYLRVHMPDQWSATTTEIAETHDERLAREKAEKSGKLDRENQMANALVELAKLGQLPQAIANALAQVSGPAPVPALTGMLECPSGHATAAPAKFCSECAAPLSAPAARASIPGPQQPAREPAQPADGQRLVRMRDGRNEVLRAFARANGLDDGGKRPDLISRLSNAGLTAKFSAFNAAYQPGAAAA